MTTFFVTATGTDVGKTYVTSLVVKGLRAQGRAVRALKPVATGFDAEHPERSDAGALLSALGSRIDAAALDRVSPWRFAAPLSPDIASAREGRTIDWAALIARCRAEIAAAASEDAVLLIEGIGGVMVPLDERHTVLDWIAELDVPALLVAGSYLGTLSHTLTAAGMLAARGVTVKGVVVDESLEQPVPPDETAAVLRRFVAPTKVVVVPRVTTDAETDASKGSERAIAELVALLDSA